MEFLDSENELLERASVPLLPEDTKGVKSLLVKEDGILKLLTVYNKEDPFETGYGLGKSLKKFKFSVVDLRKVDNPYAIVTGLALTAWDFDKYKSDKKERTVYFVVRDCDELKEALEHARAQMFARELASEPPNQLNPRTFPDRVREVVRGLPISVTVLEKEDLEKEGLNLLLAVGKGSDIPPRLMILEYNGGGKKVSLVGKGVTFDAGGYDLKPPNYMEGMHADMSGAAAVTSATIWAAKLNLDVNLVTLVPLAENLISGRAYKPEDIIKSYSGKYVHISNTDAEGRLILADALTYAKKYSPSVTFTLATLTGAQIIALGYDIAALYATDDELAKVVEEASKETGELVWRMPLYKKYKEYLSHPAADIANISKKRQAGSIMGALFLKEFAPEPWVYLDIAGPAMANSIGASWCSPYPTGWGTRLMLRTLKKMGR
ncbi:peptidase M17 [Ignicoccus pacificus DSM 13166]|uniref:Peptidase M17 n=1 Tax=Ignicoccus pacificus DSM 13166 TaxID=940294 RepID=A0A977KA88_9CREN|nr:peptidase M17 [Ignicoccus pacificus DSM 13166]